MTDAIKKPDRHSNARGLSTCAQIIQAAEQVLREDGYHGFTTRRVADVCGISKGNLGYHFPTKQKLFEALVTEIVQRYEEEYRARSEHFSRDAISAFDSAVRWLIADTFQQYTGELFIELWTHAKHSKPGEKTIAELYKTGFVLLEEMIAKTYPESDPAKRRRAAIMLVTFIEGSTVLRQSGAFSRRDLEEVVEDALTLIYSLLGQHHNDSL